MTRVKASLSHFLISVVIFSLIVFILLYLWYPTPHFTASGGWQGLKIVAGVDVILGPLLTFIIFNVNKSKKELFTDMSIIVLIQTVALVWGTHALYQQRPVALVFWEGSFISVPARALTNQNIDLNNLTQFGESLPVLIYAERPQDAKKRKVFIEKVDNEHIPPHHQFGLYQPLKRHFSELKTLQVDMDPLLKNNKSIQTALEVVLLQSGSTRDDYQYYRLNAKYKNAILLFNNEGILENHLSYD